MAKFIRSGGCDGLREFLFIMLLKIFDCKHFFFWVDDDKILFREIAAVGNVCVDGMMMKGEGG